MFCPECGDDLIEGSKFCGHCGTSLLTVQKERKLQDVAYRDAFFLDSKGFNENFVLRYVLASVFIISCILLFVFCEDMDLSDSTYGQFSILEMPRAYLFSYRILNAINTQFKPILVSVSFGISLLAGIALLLNKKGACKFSLVAAVIQLITAFFNIVLIVLLYIFPHSLISLFYVNGYSINDIAEFIRTDPYLVSHSLLTIIPRIIVLIVSASVVLICRHRCKKQDCSLLFHEKTDAPIKGLAILILFIYIFEIVYSLNWQVFTSFNNAVWQEAYAYLSLVMDENVIVPQVIIFFIFAVICLLLHKVRYRIIAPIATGVILLDGLFRWIISLPRIDELGMREEVYSIFEINYPVNCAVYVLKNVVLFLAIFAIVKEYLPVWLETFTLAAVMILYILFELVLLDLMMLFFDCPIFIGEIVFSVIIMITIIVSTVFHRRKKCKNAG